MRNIILTVCFLCVLPANAQISTFDKERKSIEKPIAFQYDSLTNIEFYNKNNGPNTDYIHYYSEGKRTEENLSHLIGQRLYFYGDTAEMAKTSWLKFYRINYGKNKKKQARVYFPYTDFLNKYFTLADVSIEEFEHYTFKLLPNNETDTLYCRMNNILRRDFWTVEGYYEKAKKDFLNKEYVLAENFRLSEEENWLYSLEDDHCGKDLPLNTIWKCVDVTLKGYKTECLSLMLYWFSLMKTTAITIYTWTSIVTQE